MLDALTVILALASIAAAIAGLRWPEHTRALAGLGGLWVAGMLAIVMFQLDKPGLVLPLALACLMLGLVAGAARTDRGAARDVELQSHLARCRRRGESASVLVAALPKGALVRKSVMGALRVTDSSAVRRVSGQWELHAILDGDDVQRHIVEQRVEVALAGAGAAFGWARFPEDGLTLEALLETARTGITRAAVPARQAGAGARASDDPARAV